MLNMSPGNFIFNDEFLQKKNKVGERDQQGECKNCSS